MQLCKCGFKFAGPGEFRNCEAFISDSGKGGYICPEYGKAYVDGKEVKLETKERKTDEH